MKLNRLKRSLIRTALVWCLLGLWLTGSVQASVHAAVMTSPAAPLAIAATLMPAEVPEALDFHSQPRHSVHHAGYGGFAKADITATSGAQSDAPCVEVCVLMSLAPAMESLPQTKPGATLFVKPLGVPAGLTQPAVPPPRSLLV